MSDHDDTCEFEKFGFGGKNPVPARSSAMALAQMALNLQEAHADLVTARRNTPDYTAQWSTSDYTAEAQEGFNRAADDYEDAVLRSVLKSPRAKMMALDAKVVGPWLSFNESEYAERRRIKYAPDASARFTPSSKGEEPVVMVIKRTTPREPLSSDFLMGEEDEYRNEKAQWDAQVEDCKDNPWRWTIQSPYGEYNGVAETREDAMGDADGYLTVEGWTLCNVEGA